MKKFLLCVVALACAGCLFAEQTPHRKAYIGICLGPAFPTGVLSDANVTTGMQLNLVNFGYVIGEHVGIAAT